MNTFKLPFKPSPWLRAGRFGDRYYDRQAETKRAVQAIVRSQRTTHEIWSVPLKVTFEFHMAIPKHSSKPLRQKMLHGPHALRPDLDNLIKFLKDALTGLLWVDDAVIFEIHAKKFYSGEECTYLKVEMYDGGEVRSKIGENLQLSSAGNSSKPSGVVDVVGND